MDTNKILTADILDLIFDRRNKDYGAYELRKTYHRRIQKALIITGGLLLLTVSGLVMANKLSPRALTLDKPDNVVKLIEIPPDVPVEPPPPPKPPEPEPPTRTEQYTTPVISPNDEVDEPPPTVDDLKIADVDVKKSEGPEDTVIQVPKDLDGEKGIIEPPRPKDEGPLTIVQIQAQYSGDWIKFLTRNLNAQVGLDNGAPNGSYGVLVQFVVDVDGTISDVRALTNHGYGLEQEAMRVIKKSKKWEPAFQNGTHVKAYRKQMITFEYKEE